MALLDPRANIGLIDAALRSIGPAEQHVVRLDASGTITDENFEYSDLIKGGPLGRCVGAIVEKDGSPLVYLAAVPIEAPDLTYIETLMTACLRGLGRVRSM
jgi:hypothetical protein